MAQNFRRGDRWMTLAQAQEYDRKERNGELIVEENALDVAPVEKSTHIAPIERTDEATLERDRLVSKKKIDIYGDSLVKNDDDKSLEQPSKADKPEEANVIGRKGAEPAAQPVAQPVVKPNEKPESEFNLL